MATPELVNIHRGLRCLERDGCVYRADDELTVLQVNAGAVRAYADLGMDELLSTARINARLLSHKLPAPIAATIARLAVNAPPGLRCL
jgi:hypothetical protein